MHGYIKVKLRSVFFYSLLPMYKREHLILLYHPGNQAVHPTFSKNETLYILYFIFLIEKWISLKINIIFHWQNMCGILLPFKPIYIFFLLFTRIIFSESHTSVFEMDQLYNVAVYMVAAVLYSLFFLWILGQMVFSLPVYRIRVFAKGWNVILTSLIM